MFGGLVLDFDEHAESGCAFHQRGDSTPTHSPDDQVALRKTEVDPWGSGVAEIALRLDRLLGMSTRSAWGALAAH
jgi:hypothetical protein